MNIQTKFLGEVEISESEVLTFEQGLPGFPDNKKFVLLSLDADLPLAVLQSTEEVELSFVVAFPYAFKKDYAFDLSEEDKEQLQIEQETDVVAYTIMTLKESFNDSTLNLLAPVVINTRTKLGKQIVLQDSKQYPLQFPVNSEATVDIQTKFLGEVKVKESDIMTFEEGLPGFPDNKQFVLLALDADLPIAYLQSTEDVELSFVVAFPYAFNKDYAFDLSAEDKAALQIETEDEVLAYTIVTLGEIFADSTLNLLAPIVINNRTKQGKQIVLQDSQKYALRYPLGAAFLEGSAK